MEKEHGVSSPANPLAPTGPRAPAHVRKPLTNGLQARVGGRTGGAIAAGADERSPDLLLILVVWAVSDGL